MQITTTKENLVFPLSLVAGAADTRGTVPMLGTVLLKATDAGKLSMLCSDTGMLARTLSPCEVKKGGEIAVDVRRFGELVRAFPEKQPIDISVEEKGTLLVKSGRSRFRLPALAAADYPRMTQTKDDRLSITMSAKRLADMIGEVTPSIADGDLRLMLNGALFCLDAAGLWMVSTDGHRMSVSHEPILSAEGLEPRNLIVPRKTVLLAKKLLGQGGNVTLTLGKSDVQFTFEDGTVLLGKSIDGQFPDWKRVIPATTERVLFSAQRLSNALAMMSAAIDDKEKESMMKSKVEVVMSKTTTALRRGDSGLCEIESESTSDKPFEVAFNIGYLIAATATISAVSEEVVVGYGPNSTAITLKPKDKEYPLAVVMPLRV